MAVIGHFASNQKIISSKMLFLQICNNIRKAEKKE